MGRVLGAAEAPGPKLYKLVTWLDTDAQCWIPPRQRSLPIEAVEAAFEFDRQLDRLRPDCLPRRPQALPCAVIKRSGESFVDQESPHGGRVARHKVFAEYH